MPLSRQEEVLTTGGRVNQKARTRAAILDAAVELLREGKPASVPEAAARARVSVATAYRYFTSAEDLADEAVVELVDFVARRDVIEAAIDAAGDDVFVRVEVLIRELGGHMLEEQMAFRQAAKSGLDRWFAQYHLDPAARVPVRPARRIGFTHHALLPIRDQLADADYDRLVAALAIGWGTEAVISLIDVAGLEAGPALEVMVVNKAVSNLIRENKTFQIRSIIQTGAAQGMCLLDGSLETLVKQGLITKEEARRHAEDPKRFGGAEA